MSDKRPISDNQFNKKFPLLSDRQLIQKYGTSEGARRAWDTRGRGIKEEPKKEVFSPLPENHKVDERFASSVQQTFDTNIKIIKGIKEGKIATISSVSNEEYEASIVNFTENTEIGKTLGTQVYYKKGIADQSRDCRGHSRGAAR